MKAFLQALEPHKRENNMSSLSPESWTLKGPVDIWQLTAPIFT